MDADSLRSPVDVSGAVANHMTMAAVALHCIGGDEEEVTHFESEYIRTRSDVFPDASRHPIAHSRVSTEKNSFAERMGLMEAVFSVRDFFRLQICTRGVTAVFQEFLPLMEPWLHHGQWHPLLRLAFVEVSGHPDARLFADGLAYLASKCRHRGYSGSLENLGVCLPDTPAAALPVKAASWELGDPVSIWARLRAKQARSGQIDAWLAAQLRGKVHMEHPHDDVSSVLSAQFLCTLPELTSWALGGTAVQPPVVCLAGPLLPSLVVEMGRLAMRLFLTIPRGSTLHGFTVAQGVASLCASGLIMPEQQARIVSRFWVWLTGLYVEKDTPELVSLTVDGCQAMASVKWNDLLAQVRVMSEHAHVIKLAYSCHWFWCRADPDPLVKFAVVRALEAAHPWRADQSFRCERHLQATAASEAFRADSRAKAKAHVQELAKSASRNAAWEQSVTPWDLQAPNKVLVSCLDRVPLEARCLVLGCGSGHDLLALASSKRSVCGLEISEAAGRVARRTVGARSDIQIVVADFFTFAGAYNFIFDHTFFSALPPSLREPWALKIVELLEPGGLLLAVVWPLGLSAADDTVGPPFKSSVELYHQLLSSKGMELETLRTESITDNMGQRTLATTWWRRGDQTLQDLGEIARVLGHWFQGEGGSHNPDHLRAGTGLTQLQFWMLNVDHDHDTFIESEFKALYKDVRMDQAKLQRWRNTSKGCVALVLLLDQFPRHMFRGTPRMFESDDLAMEVAGHAFQTYGAALVSPTSEDDKTQRPFGWPLTWCEVWFLTLPWSHSERLSDHDVGIAHVEKFSAIMPETSVGDASRAHFGGALRMAQQHRSLLEKFGRFPHRNSVLGRQPTELEEREWSPRDFFEGSVTRAKAAHKSMNPDGQREKCDLADRARRINHEPLNSKL